MCIRDSDNAEAYLQLLQNKVLPDIQARQISGYLGAEVLRREISSSSSQSSSDEVTEIEFVTILRFESLDSIRNFVGEDHEVAHVPDSARQLLTRFDARSVHYQSVFESQF